MENMENYKAIVLDLDGTLLKRDETISTRNKEFLLEQKERGVKIILATGRPIMMALKYHEELQLDTPLICLNGAVIYDRLQQMVLHQSMIRNSDVYEVYNVVSNDANVLISHTPKSNYQIINTIGNDLLEQYPIKRVNVFPNFYEPILKLSVHFKNVSSASYALAKLLSSFEIANWGDSFEITKKSVTKWYGLKKVLKHYHYLPQEVIAFGDGPNDVEMLKNVGVGVAMENGRFMAKKVAKYLTLNHENDGVAEFFTLNKRSSSLIG